MTRQPDRLLVSFFGKIQDWILINPKADLRFFAFSKPQGAHNLAE